MYLICRTIGLSDYRGVGLLDRGTIRMSYYRSDHVKDMAYAQFNIFIVHLAMKFWLCLTCNSGRDEYWKCIDILLLLLLNDILQL
jgi:hypothetical protein